MSDYLVSLKSIIKRSFTGSGVLRLARRFAEPSITILRYHSIQEDPEQNAALINSSIVHSLALFSKQMEVIANRFTPVSLDDILLTLDGKRPFPENAVAVTFDDGFADNFFVAGPILRRFSIPATFYITVNSIVSRDLPWFCRIRYAFEKTRKNVWFDTIDGINRSMVASEDKYAVFRIVANRCAALSYSKQQKYVKEIEVDFDIESPNAPKLMLDWDEIRKLHKDGHIIGSHTMSHPNVAHIETGDQYLEINNSKQILERELGFPCEHFSYPHPTLSPHYNAQTIMMTREAGYKMATTTTHGTVKMGDDALAIKRIAVPKNLIDFAYNLERFAMK